MHFYSNYFIIFSYVYWFVLVFVCYCTCCTCCTCWVSLSTYFVRILNSASNYCFYLLKNKDLVYSYDLHVAIYTRYCLFFYYSYYIVVNSCYSSSFFLLSSYYILFPITFVSISYYDNFLLNSSVSDWFCSMHVISFVIFVYIYSCKLDIYILDYDTLAVSCSLNVHC